MTKNNENTFTIQSTCKRQGDYDFHVFMLQCALAYHEYHFGYINDELGVLYSAGIDGIFGKRTTDAIIAFQRDHDLATTGTANVETATALLKDYNLMECD